LLFTNILKIKRWLATENCHVQPTLLDVLWEQWQQASIPAVVLSATVQLEWEFVRMSVGVTSAALELMLLVVESLL